MAVRTLGILVAGIGTTGATSPAYLLSTQTPSSATAIGSYIGVLMSIPDAIEQRLDDLRATRILASPFSFDVLVEGTYQVLVDALTRTSHSRQTTATTALATAIATTFDVASVVGIAVQGVIHWEREAMRVDGIVGTTLTVVRGQWGTEAVPHTVGATDDIDIYTTPHILRDREVTVYAYDQDAATETVIARGYVEDVAILHGQRVHVSCRSALGMLGGVDEETARKLARPKNALRALLAGNGFVGETPDGSTFAGVVSTTGGYWRLGDSLYEVTYLSAVTDSVSASINPESPLLGTTQDERLRGVLDAENVDDIHEVYWADTGLTYGPCYRQGATPGTATDHPLDVALNILTSRGGRDGANGNYDWAPGRIGLGIRSSLVDVAGVERLRDTRFQGWRASNFLIGWEGEESAWDAIDRLLRPLRCFVTLTGTGLITIRQLGDASGLVTTTAVGEAQILPDPPPQHNRNLGRVTTSVVTRGDMIPSGEYQTEIRTLEARERVWYPYTGDRLTVEGDWLGSGDLGDESILHDSDLRRLLESMAKRDLRMWRRGLPTYEISVDLSRQSLAVGDVVLLTHRATRAPGGTLGLTSQRCVVIGRTLSLTDFSSRLVLLDVQAITAKTGAIGPSARVDAWNGVTFTLTVEANTYTIGADSDLGYTSDATAFRSGEKVVLVDERGVIQTDPNTISGAPVGNTIVLTGGFITIGAGPAYTPQVDDVLVHARHDEVIAQQRTDYHFLADSTPALGAANDPAYEYTA